MASEMGEFYTAKRKEQQEKRAKKWAENMRLIEKLLAKAPGFSMQKMDRGSYLRISHRGLRVDYWPGTQTVMIVGTSESKKGFDPRGVINWMRRLAEHREQERAAAAQ